MERPGKKTAAAVHQEIEREIKAWLSRIFTERRKTGRTDLEAVEMDLRKTMLQVGAAAMEELLQYEEPASDERQRACGCGHTARYVDLRSKTILTVLGKAELRRPYYLCARCGGGTVSSRCGTGRGENFEVTRGPAHAGDGGTGCAV